MSCDSGAAGGGAAGAGSIVLYDDEDVMGTNWLLGRPNAASDEMSLMLGPAGMHGLLEGTMQLSYGWKALLVCNDWTALCNKIVLYCKVA